MTKVNPDGFRKDTKPFFNQFVLSVPITAQQISPFLVTDGNKVNKVSTVAALLECKDKAEVLQTWPGKKRSDVFYFTVKDLKNHMKGGE